MLIADDEPAVLEVVRSMARALGWRTLLADSGAQALAALRAHGRGVHRALLDVHMPGMDSGVLTALRREFPLLPVTLMTGDSDARTEGRVPFEYDMLAKPFELGDLQAALEPQSDERRAA